MAKTIPIDIGTGTVRSEKELDALLEQLGLGARVSPLLSMAKTREEMGGKPKQAIGLDGWPIPPRGGPNRG